MADIKISELSQAESLSLSDLMESAIPYNGGFQSRRMTIAQLSNYLENSVLHNALDTTTKNIIGAINEILHDLANYYTTSQTYSKTEVDTLIAGVSGLHFEVVNALPTQDIDMNTIYLVPKQDSGQQDVYDEFICLDDTTTPATWEKIGTTEIDLSDYVTDTELAAELLNYVTTSALNTTLQSYATTSAMTTALADKVDKVQGKGLSTEDYTTVEKAKLNGIESGAQVNDHKVAFENVSSNPPTRAVILIKDADDISGNSYPQFDAGSLFYYPTISEWRLGNIHFRGEEELDTGGTGEFMKVDCRNSGRSKFYNLLVDMNLSDNNDVDVKLPSSSGQLALSEETVKWSEQNVLGAKNLLPYPYQETTKTANGITYTDNGDGTVTVSGTASANTRFSFDDTIDNPINYPLQGGQKYLVTRGYTATTNAYMFIRAYYTPSLTNADSVLVELKNEDKVLDLTSYPTIYGFRSQIVVGNGTVISTPITFKPMIRLQSILDDTYEPFAMTNNQLTERKVEWESQNILGSKNLLPYPYINNIGVTSAGVTYTVDEKGWIHCSGTSTGNSIFTCSDKTVNGGMFLPNGNYRVSGCPEGGSSSGGNGAYQLIIDATISGATYTYCYETGDGAIFTVNGDDFSNDGAWVRVRCVCRKTVVSDSLVFKPMVMLASIKDNTYEPQANTNRQLTLNKIDKDLIAPTENGFNASQAYAVGDYMFWRRGFYRVTTAISQGGAITNGTNVTQTTLGAELKRALS